MGRPGGTDVQTLFLVGVTILLLAVGLILFMFTLMARVSNPLTPRALFGILNVLTAHRHPPHLGWSGAGARRPVHGGGHRHPL